MRGTHSGIGLGVPLHRHGEPSIDLSGNKRGAKSGIGEELLKDRASAAGAEEKVKSDGLCPGFRRAFYGADKRRRAAVGGYDFLWASKTAAHGVCQKQAFLLEVIRTRTCFPAPCRGFGCIVQLRRRALTPALFPPCHRSEQHPPFL